MPVVTAIAFQAEFPEFKGSSRDVVQAELDRAERQVSSEVWEDQQADGIKYLAAHRLALRPGSEQARLKAGSKNDSAETTYLTTYKSMLMHKTYGYRVI